MFSLSLPSLFSANTPLDEDSIDWLFDTYAWALSRLDSDFFTQQSQLVLPTREHFPDPANNPEDMARQTFKRVKGYAGLSQWPIDVVAPGAMPQLAMPELTFANGFRGEAVRVEAGYGMNTRIQASYNPNQLKQPPALIASFAHHMAGAVMHYSGDSTPGGRENWPQVSEVVACFMGFGLMFANSAYNFRGGCGSCHKPITDRQSALAEPDVTYALALFCVLKGIPNSQVVPHLKKYLRSLYKQCVKDINNRSDQLAALRTLL